MKKLIEKIEAPLKENPDLSNPTKGSYYDGYRSATINILAIIKAENLAIADVVKPKGTFCQTPDKCQMSYYHQIGDYYCSKCEKTGLA